MRIYFATWMVDRNQGGTLNKKKAFRRLLSYFFLRSQDVPDEGFVEYVETGKFDLRKKK